MNILLTERTHVICLVIRINFLINLKDIICGHVRRVILSIIFSKLYLEDVAEKIYRQIVGIPMGSNYAPPVVDLFLVCYERDFIASLSDNDQADVIEAFNFKCLIANIYSNKR